MKVQIVKVERVVIDHTHDEIDQAFNYCNYRKYKIIRSGPATLDNPTRHRIIAEKYLEVTDGTK